MRKYRLWFLFVCLLLCVNKMSAVLNAQTTEPCERSALTIVAGTPSRPSVEGDYLVIEYNARSLQTFWYDYHRPATTPMAIDRNGSFMPVVYTKEKIAVHVCDLHFGDLLTVTTSPLGTPEGGADIRGTTPAAIPSLTNTLDSLQSATATGGIAPVSNLGFGATTAVGGTAVSGVTPGSISTDATGKTTYTGATVTASGEQIAITMYSLETNAEALITAIDENIGGYSPAGTSPANFEPGSVGYLKNQSAMLRGTIHNDYAAQGSYRNGAAFDRDVTAVQSFAAEFSALANALQNQAFGARAVMIQNNYATLRGLLDFIDSGNHCAATTVPSLFATTKNPVTTDQPLGVKPATPCTSFEKAKFEAFYNAYDDRITHFRRTTLCTVADAAAFNACVRDTQEKMFDAVGRLSKALGEIDGNVSSVFNDMNSWNDHSGVEQTDLIAPVTGNAVMRISIIVQRGYTPFVLANIPSSAPAPAAAPAAAAAPPVASTSTPPHAVKTILVEVHRVANFNLTGGMMFIHVPTTTYSVVTAPAPATASTGTPTTYSGTCNGATVSVPPPVPPASGTAAPPNYACIVATQKTQWQLAGMVGVTWYPWGRDYFPRHSGSSSYRRNLMPSFLLATSVTSLGNAVGALNWEPIGGIDLFAGIGSAHRTVLPGGISTTTAVPTGYTLQTVTQEHAGFATGIAFDLSVFMQLFQKTTPAGMP
jgi:hypothetical protein